MRSSKNPSLCHPRLSKDIQGIPAERPSKGIPDIPVTPDIPVIHDLKSFQAILQVPVSPGNPPHSSILQSECIFYNFNSSICFHRKLHRVPVGQHKLQTFILQRKGDVVISVRIDTIDKIELNPSFVLSSDNTNCKNDIQLFHQLFDELSVNGDYH